MRRVKVMGSYIKFRLKKVISLVLVYGLILGSVSFVAPFIGTQRIYAGEDEQAEQIDLVPEFGADKDTTNNEGVSIDIIDDVPFDNLDHEAVELVAGDFYRVRVFAAKEDGSKDPIKVDNSGKSYIEATAKIRISLEEFITINPSFNPDWLTLYYDKIPAGEMREGELADVGCGESYDWLSDDESSVSSRKNIESASAAEATFCYFANTTGQFNIDFKADLHYDTDGTNKQHTLEMTIPVNVSRRKITIDTGDYEITYGDYYPEFINGIVEGYEIVEGSLIHGDVELDYICYSPEIADDVDKIGVGVYRIIPSWINEYYNKNYEISFIDRYLTINPALITVKADNVTKRFGEADPSLTYTIIDGYLMYDDELAGSLARVKGEHARKEAYEINIGTLRELNPNYLIGFVTGGFTISERPVVQVAEVTPVAVSETDIAYDRVGVVDTGEPKSVSTVEVKKEETKKIWTILGLAWYWWILAISAFGGLTWWFSPNKPTKESKNKVNKSKK